MSALTCTRGAKYEYKLDEVNLFSVSQIRKVAYDPYRGIPAEVLAQAAQRGTRLHRRFWRVLAAKGGLLDWPQPLLGLEGYCASMDEWAVGSLVLPIRIEQPSWSLKLGYAGTPDGLVRLWPKQTLAIIDLKTGQPSLTDPMQLLAYHKMEGYEGATALLDVYIQADGSAAIERPVTPAMKVMEWCWFLSALGVLQSRTNHGVT
jgi:hypothetical protein